MENINNAHTSIKQWAEDDRPREKMIHHGAASLSPAELLAILINNGTRSKTAMDLAKELLAACQNSLHLLSRMNLKDLQKIKGIGPAKAVVIKAASELAIKQEEEVFVRERIKNSTDLVKYLQRKLQNESREHFITVFLNQRNRVITHEVVSSGGVAGTVVDPRIIMRRALELQASSMVLCHNHPSGKCEPSDQDKDLTKKLKNAAVFFDMRVLDHIIVSDEEYFSFAENGAL